MQFKEISGAYEVLADEKKRQLYDDGGEDALKEGGMGNHASPFDVFDMFFGGGGRRRGGEKKGKNTIHALKVCTYIYSSLKFHSGRPTGLHQSMYLRMYVRM